MVAERSKTLVLQIQVARTPHVVEEIVPGMQQEGFLESYSNRKRWNRAIKHLL